MKAVVFGTHNDDRAALRKANEELATSHMGVLTREALAEIANTTVTSVSEGQAGRGLTHEITA
ncbi:MAG TPA: hypothetical protein VGV37_12485 [Aliidongia sp.]|uniref:hypothetical protein n=1 Tax=Aliidongia sp. TaxID=1914230 RepID=UPI002DDD639A|nr:hypothetical protein [Aliidongia sp.]HEV2675351.1 hypothetical protein [Aliidongia sp.]